MMVRRPVVAMLVSVGALLAPTASGLAAAGPPEGVRACLDGGWRHLTDGNGNAFRNRGQCIRWAIHHPPGAEVDLSALAGSFEGGSFVEVNPNCAFARQYLYATYVPVGAAEAVTLGMQGCITLATDAVTASYSGLFEITSAAGNVSGTVAGTVAGAGTSDSVYDLTLTATSGTGAFEGASGTLDVEVLWDWASLANTTTGTVSIP